IKYSPEIAEKLINQTNEIEVLSKEYDSDRFAINIKQNLFITKKKDEADFVLRLEKNADTPIDIIKELKDHADTHKYYFENVITAVQERLKKKNIKMSYSKGFNSYVMNEFLTFYS